MNDNFREGKMNRKVALFFIFCVLFAPLVHAQDSLGTAAPEIRVLARVSTKEIPLNRNVIFTVQVEWAGDMDRYEISEIENPEVRNFKIMSNSSADRREMENNVQKAIKTFEFELAPEELGMGYIEGVIIKYLDVETGDGKHLITNRLEVKVVDPLPEPGSRAWIYKWIAAVLILIALGIILFIFLKRRAAEKARLAEEAAVVSLEERYLEDLKQSIPLGSPDLDVKNGFSVLSRVFRKYLSEKYDFSAVNEVREEIIGQLKQNSVPESLINNADEVLSTCDLAKFSGGEGDRTALERVFTLVESFILTNSQTEKHQIEEAR